MRRLTIGLGALMVVLSSLVWPGFVYAQARQGAARDCPPGKVWGGRQCEDKELCDDGYPPDAWGSCERRPVAPPRVPSVRRVPEHAELQPSQPAQTKRHACQDGIVFYPDGKAPTDGVNRSLLVANGSVSELLEAYIAEMNRLDVAIDFKTFSVYFHEDGKSEPTRLKEGDGVESFGFSKVFFMVSRKKLWLDAAAKFEAQPVSHARLDDDIDRYRADASCGR